MSFIAPCGHPGEPIIGTFVRCLHGCDDTKAKVVAQRRGLSNHVEMCACVQCQIRRKVETIVIIAKDGSEMARVHWDGVTAEIYCLWENKMSTSSRIQEG